MRLKAYGLSQEVTDAEVILHLCAKHHAKAAPIKANDELRFSNQEFSHVKERLDHVLEYYCARMPEVKYFMEHFVRLCWATVDQLAGVDQSHQA